MNDDMKILEVELKLLDIQIVNDCRHHDFCRGVVLWQGLSGQLYWKCEPNEFTNWKRIRKFEDIRYSYWSKI